MTDKYKVLIVDDKEEILCFLKRLLENETSEFETTKSAVDAFEKVKSDKYHLVVIDIDNPEMDGIELLKMIKSYDALTQVVVMTEHSTMDKILSSLEYGANDYISEPLKNAESVIKAVACSFDKLERWRNAFVELFK